MTEGHTQAKPEKTSGHQKTILLVLAVAALATIFLLPNFVTEPWINDGASDGAPVPDQSVSAVSPSTAAEKTKYRQDSQTVLAQIIPVRDRLVGQSVATWSPVEFQMALDKIATGDEKYSYGDYRDALGSYQQALEELTTLEALGQDKLRDALDRGLVAVESLNIEGAATAGELAIAIAPDDKEAQTLAARLKTLPGLADHLEAGDQAKQMGDFSSAQKAYQNAVDLDGLHNRAVDSLAAIKKEITESRFRSHMSQAYAAMESGDFTAALAAFDQAATIYPKHSAIAQGRAQVENRGEQVKVSGKITSAARLEQAEAWSEAVLVYEELLEQDPTLTDARVKLIPAQVRASLDQRLVELIEEPLRLSQEPLYRQAQAVLNDAMGIPNPGNRLSSQIDELKTLLQRATTSVDVVFQSDNQTVVTLFRVAQLGQFQQTSLTLKPGKYIAGGTRQGYRDVRVEFTVTGEPLDGPVIVRCEESI